MARTSTARACACSPAGVESYRGFVFACFDPGVADLRTYLAGAGMHREHGGRPCRADDELQMRAFWRRWQTLMSVG